MNPTHNDDAEAPTQAAHNNTTQTTPQAGDPCDHCGQPLQEVEVYDKDTLQTVDHVLSCTNSHRWDQCPEVIEHQ